MASTLVCTGRDGIDRTFYFEYDIDGNECRFRIASDEANLGLIFFEFNVHIISNSTARIIQMNNFKILELSAKGIPDSLIPKVSEILNRTIVSSSNKHKGTGEWRSPDADKVWRRLRINLHACYDKINDVYTYFKPDKRIRYTDLLNEYVGSGNPNDSYWFIGLEWSSMMDENEDCCQFIERMKTGMNSSSKEPWTDKNFFSGIGYILRELGLTEHISKDGNNYYIDFTNDGKIFWTNTSLCGFSDSSDEDKHQKTIDRLSKCVLEIQDLIYNDFFWKEEFLNIRKKKFQELILSEVPKILFCIGRKDNWERLKILLQIDGFVLRDTNETVNVSYKTPKSSNSTVSFFKYSVNNIKFQIVVCPFFGSRWTNMEQDIKSVCEKAKSLIEIE